MSKHEPVEIAEGTVVQNRPLTTQEELLLHDRRMSVDMVVRAGNNLDGKALGLLQAASLVLALFGVLGLSERLPNLAEWALFGLILALGAFALMIMLSVIAWHPQPFFLPGLRDWDEMWATYVVADTTKVYLQVIADYNKLIKMFEARNDVKGQAVIGAAFLFVVQIAGLLILAFAG